MRIRLSFCAFLCAILACTLAPGTRAEGAFLIEIDTDGADDGPITYNPNFSFGGDTTTASTSILSTAVGLSGADSIFGGDGVNEPDTYEYSYTLGVDADNLALAAGTDLGDGNVATGITGGKTGVYNVYATWPFTTNVSGGLVTFTLTGGGGTLFSTQIDQNNQGNAWVLLGSASLQSGVSYTLSQVAGSNTFVSMRAAGVLFEAVSVIPEPSSLALVLVGGVGISVFCRRARRSS
ncbi:PEP-CTERM sorting domain-containing protein [Tautonia sp. JC769]|uniref:PEP-CTERM sorting domain-containing protein n=1 Tax=Tautonia sp. JC769 TaxID=3232135 RepID=UPI003457858E